MGRYLYGGEVAKLKEWQKERHHNCSVQTTVHIPLALYIRITEEAISREVSRGEIIRQAIQKDFHT